MATSRVKRVPVECSFYYCDRKFNSNAAMIQHKIDEPEHDYCEKCKVDCASFEELIAHKVEAMRPFLEEDKQGEATHIVCEFCGMDFRSWEGRSAHREKIHQQKQQISCNDCPDRVFGQASDFIRHIENGQCRGTTRSQLYAMVKQKIITKQVMENYDYFKERIEENLEKIRCGEGYSTGAENHEDEDSATDSGVTLSHSIESSAAINRPQLRERDINVDWPNLQSLSLKSEERRIRSSSNVADGCKGAKPVVAPTHAILTPDARKLAARDVPSHGVRLTESSSISPPAWNSGKASSSLFPPAKAVALISSQDEEVAPAPCKNAMKAQWWNADSPDYRADAFYNSSIERYECPIHKCRGVWEHPMDFALHLSDHGSEGHASDYRGQPRFRCKWCSKIFDQIHKLVAHMQTPGAKCRAHKSDYFPRFLDEITGGLLQAESVVQPSILGAYTDASLVKFGQPERVMDMKYTSTPSEMRW